MEVWKLIASNWYLAFSEQFEVERKKKYGFDVLMKTHFHALFFFFQLPKISKNFMILHVFSSKTNDDCIIWYILGTDQYTFFE